MAGREVSCCVRASMWEVALCRGISRILKRGFTSFLLNQQLPLFFLLNKNHDVLQGFRLGSSILGGDHLLRIRIILPDGILAKIKAETQQNGFKLAKSSTLPETNSKRTWKLAGSQLEAGSYSNHPFFRGYVMLVSGSVPYSMEVKLKSQAFKSNNWFYLRLPPHTSWKCDSSPTENRPKIGSQKERKDRLPVPSFSRGELLNFRGCKLC